MKLLKLLIVAGVATAAFGMSSSADARWHPDRHHRWHHWGHHCHMVWHHHHRVRVCR